MRILDLREITVPIASSIANAYIDFSKMTLSLVALVTDVVRDGRPVVGYGFNSNGRYGQGGLIRERFAPRLAAADPKSLLDDAGDNLDPDRIWATLMKNEKPGGHGERSVAVGTIDMAVWDATAKIAGKPLFRLIAERHARTPDPRVFVYAAGGYYYPGKGIEQRLRIGLLEPRRKPLADQPALPVAAVGIEAVANHALAVALKVGDDGNKTRRHLGEIDIGIADRRGDRLCHFADVDDTDGH